MVLPKSKKKRTKFLKNPDKYIKKRMIKRFREFLKTNGIEYEKEIDFIHNEFNKAVRIGDHDRAVKFVRVSVLLRVFNKF